MNYPKTLNRALSLFCAMALLILSGCQINASAGKYETITEESYSDAEKYKTGSFTYTPNEINSVEVHWRCGEVEIVESDSPTLNITESGNDLNEDAAMHYLLEDNILKIRFCASSEKIKVNADDKHLKIEVPKGINLYISTTSAAVKAESLEQKKVLISTFSGSAQIGEIISDSFDLSSNSGEINLDDISAQTFTCASSSGFININKITAEKVKLTSSSAPINLGEITAQTAEIAAESGNINAVIAKMNEAVMCTSNANISLTLPKGGAEIWYTSDKGNLITESSYETKGDLCIFGKGENRISVVTTGGNLEIH